MKLLRVGFVSRFPPVPCGIAATLEGLLPELRKAVRLITIGSLGSRADYQVDFKAWDLKERLQDIVAKEQLDLIHVQYIAPFYGALNLNLLKALRLSVPVVTTLHEVQPEGKSPRLVVLRLIEKGVVARSGQVIVSNSLLKESLERRYGSGNVHAIPFGHVDRTRSRKSDGKTLLFFGILSRGKGVEHLIDAMRLLPGYRALIIGSLPNKDCERYAKSVRKLAAGKSNITLATKSWFSDKEKWGWYAKAGIVVLPYVWAPYNSAVVRDAVEAEIPMVITRAGAVHDVVEKKALGRVVEPESARALAQGVREAFIGRKAYAKAVEAYRKETSWKKVAQEHLKAYHECIKVRHEIH